MHEDVPGEERAIYWVTLVTLAPVVVVAAVENANFGSGTTLCLSGCVLAAIGLCKPMFRHTHLPRAHVTSHDR